MPDPKRTKVVPLSLELKDDAAARALAQRMADKTGETITVRDEDGNEVAKVPPGYEQAEGVGPAS